MFGDHRRIDTATDVEFRGQTHEAWFDGRDQIGKHLVGDRFVERPLVPIGPDIEFQRFEFDAEGFGHVFQGEFGEIRLACLRAETGEFRYANTNRVIAFRLRIGKGFQIFDGWLGMMWVRLTERTPSIPQTGETRCSRLLAFQTNLLGAEP